MILYFTIHDMIHNTIKEKNDTQSDMRFDNIGPQLDQANCHFSWISFAAKSCLTWLHHLSHSPWLEGLFCIKLSMHGKSDCTSNSSGEFLQMTCWTEVVSDYSASRMDLVWFLLPHKQLLDEISYFLNGILQ